jgi:hypothetical protein
MRHLPSRRRARQGEGVARVAAVIGLAMATGPMAGRGAQEAESPALHGACAGSPSFPTPFL